MRRILICTGVLGGGTALVFGAAAITAVMIPPSRVVPQGQMFATDRVWGRAVAPVPVVVMDDGSQVNGAVAVDPLVPEEMP